MPFRDWYLPASPYDIGFDRWGSDWDDRAQMADSQPRGSEDERYLLRCPLCHRPIAARDDCATCGDSEDMAA